MDHAQLGSMRWRRIAGALVLVMLLLGGSARAAEVAAAKQACGLAITSCGCTITKTNVYSVIADLSSTQALTSAGDCIAIQADNVVLALNGHAMVGPGTGSSTGAAIHVLAGAKRDVIEGTGTDSDTEPTGWKYGLEVEGSNTIADEVSPDANLVGIFLLKATGANINDLGLENNSVYGIWIKGGKNNQVNCAYSEVNETGVYIGCHDDDTRGTTCGKGSPTSSGNRIYDLGSYENFDAGIVIDVGNLNNVVTNVNFVGNGGDFDSIDENSDCGTNRWVAAGDTRFGEPNQACIP